MLPSDVSASFLLPEHPHFLLKAFFIKPLELALPRVPRHVDAPLPTGDAAVEEGGALQLLADAKELLGVWTGIHPFGPSFSEVADPALELFGVFFGIQSSSRDLFVDALELAGVCGGIHSLTDALLLPPPRYSVVWMLYFSPFFQSEGKGLPSTGSSTV